MNTARQLSERLAEELDSLPLRHRSLFAAATSERLLPNYQAFSLLEGWGDYGALRSGLDYVWSVVIADDVPVPDVSLVKKMRQSCRRQIPDADDFVSLFVPLAQDAAVSVMCALESIIKGDAKRTADFAWMCTRTVENYLSGANGLGGVSSPYLSHSEELPDFKRRYEGDWNAMDRVEMAKFYREQRERMRQDLSEWIWASPMMKSEQGALWDDIAFLKSKPQLDTPTIESFREVAISRGIRPLQRHFVGLSARPNEP